MFDCFWRPCCGLDYWADGGSPQQNDQHRLAFGIEQLGGLARWHLLPTTLDQLETYLRGAAFGKHVEEALVDFLSSSEGPCQCA